MNNDTLGPDAAFRPSASLNNLKLRAKLYQLIRDFFRTQRMLEVETPLISAYFTLEPHISALCVNAETNQKGATTKTSTATSTLGYLQSSPEHHMKRLLAHGSGDIYQICKAFRAQEQGRKHNREFTILEWYRLGWDYEALMDEVVELLSLLIQAPLAVKKTYQSIFETATGLNPHTTTQNALRDFAKQQLELHNFVNGMHSIADWLDLIFSHLIEPTLDKTTPLILYEFPSCQAALAETTQNAHGYPIAKRFEVFYQGFEIANGYQELTCAEEQKRRFEYQAQYLRNTQGVSRLADTYLLEALETGLPHCAGVAMGLDRILMIMAGADHISHVLAFDANRA